MRYFILGEILYASRSSNCLCKPIWQNISIDISDFKPQFGSVNDNYIIDQLNSMGIKTIADFERIIPNNFKERYSEIQRSKFGTYATGLVIWILIIHDYKRYFKEAYKDSYGIFNSHDALVFEKFGLDISKFPKRVKFDCAGL